MKSETNLIHCNSCEYEGVRKSDSAAMFMILMGMFVLCLIFIPMIIVALCYMGWMLTKPAKFKCPKCKSSDISPLTISQQDAVEEKPDDKESGNNREQTN